MSNREGTGKYTAGQLAALAAEVAAAENDDLAHRVLRKSLGDCAFREDRNYLFHRHDKLRRAYLRARAANPQSAKEIDAAAAKDKEKEVK